MKAKHNSALVLGRARRGLVERSLLARNSSLQPVTPESAWIEPLHLSRPQYKVVMEKTQGHLPVVAEAAFSDAASEEAVPDGGFFEALFDAVRCAGWRSYSMAFPDGQASLLEGLWPRPFVTHHAAIAKCERLSQETGKTVIVTFDAWASWWICPSSRSPGVTPARAPASHRGGTRPTPLGPRGLGSRIVSQRPPRAPRRLA